MCGELGGADKQKPSHCGSIFPGDGQRRLERLEVVPMEGARADFDVVGARGHPIMCRELGGAEKRKTELSFSWEMRWKGRGMNQRGSQQMDVAGKDPISLCNLQTNLEIVLNPKKESELPKFPRIFPPPQRRRPKDGSSASSCHGQNAPCLT